MHARTARIAAGRRLLRYTCTLYQNFSRNWGMTFTTGLVLCKHRLCCCYIFVCWYVYACAYAYALITQGLVCGSSFLVGLAMVTKGGSYVVELFDQFAGSLPLLLIGFCECIAVAYVYKVNRYSDVARMILT